jgi:FlaA1/EpsC-like NDP-sugar epimerase
MHTPEQPQTLHLRGERGPVGPWRPEREPLVREGAKFLLDGGLAALAWGLTTLLVGHGFPSLRATAAFTAFVLLFNAGFRYTRQHYRLVGLPEARALLLGTFSMAVAAMLLAALPAPRALLQGVWPARPALFLGAWPARLALFLGAWPAPMGSLDVLLAATLLTGSLWFSLRVGAMTLHQRRFRIPGAAGQGGPEAAGGREGGAKPLRPERALIVGAGRAGMRLSQELRENPKVGYDVVGFVDDALEKQGVRIEGIPVLGPTRLLLDYVAEQKATLVILGMAGVPGYRIRELSQRLQAQGIRVKTVPGILDLVGDRPWKPEVRDIAIEDLLRREPITLDTQAIRQTLEGSVTLITGAGGSIGSELAHRVASFGPRKLVLLGRGENSLWELERNLRRLYPRQNLAVALCDIRNPVRLHQVFETWLPQVVFHAAAHKHVPYLEQYPEEAIGNNIFGTLNVVRATLACGTGTFVNVSTDKAVNPTSVLGASKRIGEHVVLQGAKDAPRGSRFVSVRFGNVLGSRGSVIPVFRDQILRGGPLTVTHPDMVRYFMTIPEACQLVMQAGILGATGKVFALDMGEPIHIVDLARDMARLSGLAPGEDISIQFTGARPGEKFFEELFGDLEERKPGVHPKVFEAVQDPMDAELLDETLAALKALACLPEGQRQRAILTEFLKLVPSYRPSPAGLGRYLPAASAAVTDPVSGAVPGAPTQVGG